VYVDIFHSYTRLPAYEMTILLVCRIFTAKLDCQEAKRDTAVLLSFVAVTVRQNILCKALHSYRSASSTRRPCPHTLLSGLPI
jgi:hypothetical protein